MLLGVLLDPRENVKNPMVRKPVHMMKPRVVTLQKSLRTVTLEKRQHDLSRSGTNKSPSKSGSGSLLSYDGELSGEIKHLKLDQAFWSWENGKNNLLFSTFVHTCTTDCGVFSSWYKKGRNKNVMSLLIL